MTSQPNLIKIHSQDSLLTVKFSREQINEMGTARRIAGQITELIESRFGDRERVFATGSEQEQNVDEITIDMTDITFLSSVALNELINVNRQCRARGVDLLLANVPQSVRDIFALTRLERMFRFTSDQAECTVASAE